MTDQTVTFINIITTDPEHQPQVIDLLTEGTERVIRHRPGFGSVTLFASVDGRTVINLARWESADAVKATQGDPAAAEFARRTAEIAQATPGLYRQVVEILGTTD